MKYSLERIIIIYFNLSVYLIHYIVIIYCTVKLKISDVDIFYLDTRNLVAGLQSFDFQFSRIISE